MSRRLQFHNQRAQWRVSESRRFYHTLLRNFYKFLVPPERSVVELGSGTGDSARGGATIIGCWYRL